MISCCMFNKLFVLIFVLLMLFVFGVVVVLIEWLMNVFLLIEDGKVLLVFVEDDVFSLFELKWIGFEWLRFRDFELFEIGFVKVECLIVDLELYEEKIVLLFEKYCFDCY